MLAVRAKALIDGRLAPSVDDVIALAEPILKHRMALTFAARAEGEDLSAHHRPPRGGGGVTRMAGPQGGHRRQRSRQRWPARSGARTRGRSVSPTACPTS